MSFLVLTIIAHGYVKRERGNTIQYNLVICITPSELKKVIIGRMTPLKCF